MRFDQTTEDNIEWIIYIATLVFTLSMSNHDQIGLNLLFMRIFKHSLHTKFDEVLVDIVIVKIKDNWYHFKSEFFIKLKYKLILRIPNFSLIFMIDEDLTQIFKVKGSISEETMKRSVVSIVFNLKQDCLLQGQAQLDQWVVFCFSTRGRVRSQNKNMI